MHYNWNRFYDPEVGRYISADPIGLDGGMNLYAYTQNNPVNLVDPEGLFFYNPGNTPVTIKPEKGPLETVPPGGFYPGLIDGFKPPAYNGDWYKVPDCTNGTLTPWGTPIEFGLGNLIPDIPDFGKPTDRLWGRKGPDFPGRNPGW